MEKIELTKDGSPPILELVLPNGTHIWLNKSEAIELNLKLTKLFLEQFEI